MGLNLLFPLLNHGNISFSKSCLSCEIFYELKKNVWKAYEKAIFETLTQFSFIDILNLNWKKNDVDKINKIYKPILVSNLLIWYPKIPNTELPSVSATDFWLVPIIMTLRLLMKTSVCEIILHGSIVIWEKRFAAILNARHKYHNFLGTSHLFVKIVINEHILHCCFGVFSLLSIQIIYPNFCKHHFSIGYLVYNLSIICWDEKSI